MKAWAAAGDPFMAKLDRIEQFCRAILDAASMPHDRMALLAGPPADRYDAREGYAMRALNSLCHLREALGRSDARVAADFAFDLGALLAESAMKEIADQAFKSELGRAKVRAKRSNRDAEIRRRFAEITANGIPRKAALHDLETETGLKARQLREIIKPAHKK